MTCIASNWYSKGQGGHWLKWWSGSLVHLECSCFRADQHYDSGKPTETNTLNTQLLVRLSSTANWLWLKAYTQETGEVNWDSLFLQSEIWIPFILYKRLGVSIFTKLWDRISQHCGIFQMIQGVIYHLFGGICKHQSALGNLSDDSWGDSSFFWGGFISWFIIRFLFWARIGKCWVRKNITCKWDNEKIKCRVIVLLRQIITCMKNNGKSIGMWNLTKTRISHAWKNNGEEQWEFRTMGCGNHMPKENNGGW